MRKAAILIAGPTASGKSALAVQVARAVGGTVINADSMQVYRDLHVLTARPGPEDEAGVPHELFGHVDGATNYSVARYVADAAPVFDRLHQDGAVPVLVGGTGLYFKALTDGLSDIPPVPSCVRERLRSEFAGAQPTDIHAALRGLDPVMADRLRPSDSVRALRAIEVFEATGRSLSSFQGSRRPGPLAAYRLVRVFLAPDRDLLRERIDRRFAGMVAAGGLAEIEALARRDLDPALPIMRAHGVPELLAHRRGEMTLSGAIARGQADTRAYAKRQWTWARTQMPTFLHVPPERAFDAIMAAWNCDTARPA